MLVRAIFIHPGGVSLTSDLNVAFGGPGEASLKNDLDKLVSGLQNIGQSFFHQQYVCNCNIVMMITTTAAAAAQHQSELALHEIELGGIGIFLSFLSYWWLG